MADETFAGSRCVVTGGASGIGAALVMLLARRGAASVVIADIDRARCETVQRQVAEEANSKCQCLAAETDVGSRVSVHALVDFCVAELGGIDFFFSNAGILVAGAPGPSVSEEGWDRIHRINVMSHIWASEKLLELWVRAPQSQGGKANTGGHFIVTASAAGLLTQLGSLPYALTKNGAVAIAEWLAITYGNDGMRVSCLCPQAVDTPMAAGGPSVAGVDGMISAEDCAADTLDAVSKNEFLITPHKEVRDYIRRKADNPDRWIAGMRRLSAKFGLSKL